MILHTFDENSAKIVRMPQKTMLCQVPADMTRNLPEGGEELNSGDSSVNADGIISERETPTDLKEISSLYNKNLSIH